MSEKESSKEIDYWKELSAPFDYSEIKWRVGSRFDNKRRDTKYSYRMLAYIDARAVFDRLDKVLGPENWQNEIKVRNDKTISVLKIRIPGTEEWISKSDGAGDTKVEKEKGSISDAIKRSAVLFGINRKMYEFGDTYINSDNDKPDRKELKQCMPPAWYLNKQSPQEQKIIELESGLKKLESELKKLESVIKNKYLDYLKNKYEEEDIKKQVEKAKSLSLNDLLNNMYG